MSRGSGWHWGGPLGWHRSRWRVHTSDRAQRGEQVELTTMGSVNESCGWRLPPAPAVCCPSPAWAWNTSTPAPSYGPHVGGSLGAQQGGQQPLVWLLTRFPKTPGAHILDGMSRVLPEQRQAVAVALETGRGRALPPVRWLFDLFCARLRRTAGVQGTRQTDPHALSPLTPYSSAVFSRLGLELYTCPAEHCSSPRCPSAVCLVLQTTADSARSLTNLLMVLDGLEFPLRVSPSLNPHILWPWRGCNCGRAPVAHPLQGRATQSAPSLRQLTRRPMQAFLYNMVLLFS